MKTAGRGEGVPVTDRQEVRPPSFTNGFGYSPQGKVRNPGEEYLMGSDSGWIMSSRSTGNGGSCVQARRNGGLIEVRNSKNPAAGTVRFTTEEWDSFLDGAKKGEFDQLLAS
jgi:hypothetical protein